MSDEPQLPQVVTPWESDNRLLPPTITEKNVFEVASIVWNTFKKAAVGAYDLGAFLIDSKIDLTIIVLKTGIEIHHLERWKGFTRKCRKFDFTRDDILIHGGSLHAITKALKPQKEEKEPKEKTNTKARLQNLEDEIGEFKKQTEEKDTEIKNLKKTKAQKEKDLVKVKAFLQKVIDANKVEVKTLEEQLAAKDEEIAKLKTPKSDSKKEVDDDLLDYDFG